MNVMIIPSWYPSEKSPISGIFFKEQANYIAQAHLSWNIGVSLWGQGAYSLSIRKPVSSLRKIFKKIFSQAHVIYQRSDNLAEYYNPVFIWSDKFPYSYEHFLLQANEKNLLRFIARHGKVDVLHAHVSYPAGWIAMYLSKKYKIPYVITEHMSPFPFPQYLKKGGGLQEKLYQPLAAADRVIAVSPALAKRISAFIPQKDIQYIPNIVDESFFVPKKCMEKNFVFFTLGGITEQKGIDILLYAIQRFFNLRREKNIEFRIGGAGPCLEKYKELAERLKVQNRVRWLNGLTRQEALRQFQNCRCFVLPSRHETFGVVYAEAIACGKPIIATRCGGPECIVKEENGILVDVADVNNLASAMSYMYDNAEIYSVNKIRDGFLKNFSKKAVIGKLAEVYHEVCHFEEGD